MVNVLYIILGCIVLFVPGFLLSLLFYPRRNDLDFWERVGVSVGLSVLIAVLIAVAVAQPDFKMLKAVPFFGSLLALSAVFAIIAYWRGSLKWVIGLFRRGVGLFERLVIERFRRPKPKPEGPPPERPPSEQPTPERPPPERPPPERPAPEQPPPEHPAPERPTPEHPVPEKPAPKQPPQEEQETTEKTEQPG
jgi:hypothetical protein